MNKKIVDPKERFAFGKNWAQFLTHLNEQQIVEAENSLKEKLNLDNLQGLTFLDVGSGSGLFSLAAHRLGAKVISFDYDHDSVACTQYLKETYGKKDLEWSVEQGSVLDPGFLKKFGQVDILYSWGVLHHTGYMYQAFENIADLVKEKGYLFISIYNDQGRASQRWKWIKKTYVTTTSSFLRFLLACGSLFRFWACSVLKDFFRTGNPLFSWRSYAKNNRGMSPWYDLIDWVGGYPFEVARPEEVFNFFKKKGFQLEKMKTSAGGIACNEFVFIKT